MHCCTVNYLQLLQQAVVDTVQQTVAVIQPAAEEHIYLKVCDTRSENMLTATGHHHRLASAKCCCLVTLGVIGVGMGRSRAQVQIWEIIGSDFIRTDYSENKTIPHSARTLSVGLSYTM